VHVELGRDPLAFSSFQLSEQMAAATRDSIRKAWATMIADHGVVIDGVGSTDLTFTARA
jgi:hypothetical protein